jgi:hypothetical protein
MIIVLLGLTAVIAAGCVILLQVRRRRIFSLLTFYSALFLIESSGGALKGALPAVFPEVMVSSHSGLPWVPTALAISLAGYALFLYGYAVASWLTRKRAGHRDIVTERHFDRWWKPSYKLPLMAVTFFAIAVGFVQHWGRIRAAGGLLAFMKTAYQYRFGTVTEAGGETIVVVLANLIGSTAVPLTLIWVIAWLRGRLNVVEKMAVTSLVLLLAARQASTMFRAVVMFTLLSFGATYLSERKIRLRSLIASGAVLVALLVTVNFGHYYLYYLTAGWDRPDVAASMAELLTPHGHVATLALVVSKLDSTDDRLQGKGFLDSMFFFVPRAVWHSKAESLESGTLLVQGWADLPTHYQMAITAVGEWVAHFGLLGIAGMTLFGALYGMLDRLADGGPIGRAALYGALLSRVLPDSGMGISSLAITLFCLLVFCAEIALARVAAWLIRMLTRVPRLLSVLGSPLKPQRNIVDRHA